MALIADFAKGGLIHTCLPCLPKMRRLGSSITPCTHLTDTGTNRLLYRMLGDMRDLAKRYGEGRSELQVLPVLGRGSDEEVPPTQLPSPPSLRTTEPAQ